MDLLNNWYFYLGALGACASLEIVVVAGVLEYVRRGSGPRHLPSPVLFFLVPYFAFLALSYARPFLSIQDVPSVQPLVYYDWAADPYVVGLYLLGGVAFFAGYASFGATRMRYGWIGRLLVGDLVRLFRGALRSKKLPYFVTAVLVLWLVGLAANIAIFFQVRGIPLFRIGIRETEDPKLTFLAEFQPLLVLLAPFVTFLRGAVPARFKMLLSVKIYGLLILASLIALTLLGARNLPAKLALALFLFWILSPTTRLGRSSANRPEHTSRRHSKFKIALVLGVLLFVSIGVAGAFSKVEIYRMSTQQLPGTIFGTPVADSIGNLYSFEAMANYSGLYGHFRGNLFYTTLLSYIPGRDELYANYIVGEILGYPVSELQSISSTFNGPAVLDFGVLGLVLNSFLFGALLRYGWDGVGQSMRNLGAFSLYLGTIILGIHLGTYNIWTFFSVAILIGCVEYNRVP